MELSNAIIKTALERQNLEYKEVMRLRKIDVAQHEHRMIGEIMTSYPAIVKKLSQFSEIVASISIRISTGMSEPEPCLGYPNEEVKVKVEAFLAQKAKVVASSERYSNVRALAKERFVSEDQVTEAQEAAAKEAKRLELLRRNTGRVHVYLLLSRR